MELSIVIPAKNEEGRLPASLARLCRYISKEYGKSNDRVEVLVVVNGSSDQTYQIAQIFQKYFTFIRVFNLKESTGKGGAIKFGFERARGDHIAFVDADGSSSPHEVFRLYTETKEKNYDIGIANRYTTGATIIRKLPLNRVFYSKLFRITTHILFGIKYKDTQCGLKVFKGPIGQYLMANNQVNGWTFDLNILINAKNLGLKVYDMPTVWEYKPGSTLNVYKAIKSVTKELVLSFYKQKYVKNINQAEIQYMSRR